MKSPARVRIGVTDINGYFTQALVPLLGPGAMSCNFIEVIAKMVEGVLYPYTDYNRNNIIEALMSYGVDVESATDIINTAHPMVYRLISNVFSPYIGECLFDVLVEPGGTLYIENLGLLKTEQTGEFWEADAYAESIRKDVEAGSFVPERMRRAAGLL